MARATSEAMQPDPIKLADAAFNEAFVSRISLDTNGSFDRVYQTTDERIRDLTIKPPKFLPLL